MTAALEGGEWSAARPSRTGYLLPILQEAQWAPGPVWTGGTSHPHWDLILDRPACSQSLFRLSYVAHKQRDRKQINIFERKVYKRILRPVYYNGKENWRMLTSKEMYVMVQRPV